MSGGAGASANTTCKRFLVFHHDGSQSVEELKNDFGIDMKDLAVVQQRLEEQGVRDIKMVKP